MRSIAAFSTITLLAACSPDRTADRPAAGTDTVIETGRTAASEAPGDTAGVRNELMRLEREYIATATSRDSAAGARLVAADARIQNADGSVQTGAEMVEEVISGAVTFDSASIDSMQVRLLSSEVALVSGIARIRGRARAAGGSKPQEFGGTYRLLNVWQRRGGQWQLVAEAGTALRKR
jgi:hypothetical protein